MDHPYVIKYDYTSRFPIGFRGCFVCGIIDHFGTNNCSVGINSKEEKRAVLKELWYHKPHTKRKAKDGSSVSVF